MEIVTSGERWADVVAVSIPGSPPGSPAADSPPTILIWAIAPDGTISDDTANWSDLAIDGSLTDASSTTYTYFFAATGTVPAGREGYKFFPFGFTSFSSTIYIGKFVPVQADVKGLPPVNLVLSSGLPAGGLGIYLPSGANQWTGVADGGALTYNGTQWQISGGVETWLNVVGNAAALYGTYQGQTSLAEAVLLPATDAAASIVAAGLALESSLNDGTITLNTAYDAAKTAARQTSLSRLQPLSHGTIIDTSTTTSLNLSYEGDADSGSRAPLVGDWIVLNSEQRLITGTSGGNYLVSPALSVSPTAGDPWWIAQASSQAQVVSLATTVSGVAAAAATAVWAAGARTLTSYGTLVADTTTAVWAAGTRTLTSYGTLVADTAAAVWSYAVATMDGLADTTAGNWIRTILAAIKTKTDTIGSATVVNAVVDSSGDITIFRGNDHQAADGRSWDFTDPGTWPGLAGATLTLTLRSIAINTDPAPLIVTGSVVTGPPQIARFEAAHTDTAALVPSVNPGDYTFDVLATLASGNKVTLIPEGQATVVCNVTGTGLPAGQPKPVALNAGSQW